MVANKRSPQDRETNMNEYSDYSAEDLRREKEWERWAETRPICDECLEPITTDYYCEIDGKCYCWDCIENHAVRND